MIFHPIIISLFVASAICGIIVLYASSYAIRILWQWDIRSGSERQLGLERKTYLISTFLTYLFAFEILSLFLYIFTADQLHTLLTGAMCAAGSLYANEYGYPALLLKLFNFLMAGLWLILNYTDNRAYDYPLIKKKYAFLLVLAPFILLEIVLQANYFLRLSPDIITSCCGSLFSAGESNLTSELTIFPANPMKVAFYSSMVLTLALGAYYYVKKKGGYGFSGASIITFFISMLAIFSFISLYFYELPTHHCPFCFLQEEYGYIGYPLYISLLGATICGAGVGMLMPFGKIKSLKEIVPAIQKKLTLAALILFSVFSVIAGTGMVLSNLVLEG